MMSLLNPSNASFGDSTPPTTSAISRRNVMMSTEIRSVAKSAIAMTSRSRTKAIESVIGSNRSWPVCCAGRSLEESDRSGHIVPAIVPKAGMRLLRAWIKTTTQ